MRIRLNSIIVDDQAKARRFYTDVLGFREKHAIDLGEYLWLTVVSPDGPDELELVLEPNAHPVGRAYQEGLFKAGVPITAFESSDIAADVARLKAKGVEFTRDPTPMGPVTIATFADTCGNLIQLYQPAG